MKWNEIEQNENILTNTDSDKKCKKLTKTTNKQWGDDRSDDADLQWQTKAY